jgi:hypothetical protein
MEKRLEKILPDSCLNRAKETETIFVLLARDKAAADTIRYWVRKRIQIGKNKKNDKQIIQALQIARNMERERKMFFDSIPF